MKAQQLTLINPFDSIEATYDMSIYGWHFYKTEHGSLFPVFVTHASLNPGSSQWVYHYNRPDPLSKTWAEGGKGLANLFIKMELGS